MPSKISFGGCIISEQLHVKSMVDLLAPIHVSHLLVNVKNANKCAHLSDQHASVLIMGGGRQGKIKISFRVK